MTTAFVLIYLAGVALTFPVIAAPPQVIEESPFVAIAAIIGAFAWPIYWPIRFTSWLAGVAR